MSGKCVSRFTTAAAHTHSWPSLSTRFKRVPSVTTSDWSPWARGRYTHTFLFYQLHRFIYLYTNGSCNLHVCWAFQNLCINEEVRRLGSIQRINDRCMEMQKSRRGESLTHIVDPTAERLWPASTLLLSHLPEKQHQEDGAKRKRGPAKSACAYNKALALQHMRDDILGAVQDIEQLLKLGQETRSCPYYSTRLAIPAAQVRTTAKLLCCAILV